MMNLYKNRGGTPEEFVQVSSSLFLFFELIVQTNFMYVKWEQVPYGTIWEEIWVQLFLGLKNFILAFIV